MASASLGNTTYTAVKDGGGNVRITRKNDQLTDMWVPEELLVRYVADLLAKQKAEQCPYKALGLKKP